METGIPMGHGGGPSAPVKGLAANSKGLSAGEGARAAIADPWGRRLRVSDRN
jgi:hypothetical protein